MAPSSLLWALVAFTCSGSSVAQKVTQDQPVITKQEGSTVTLNCRYETSLGTYYLYWYKELPDGKLTYLIHQPSSAKNAQSGRYFIHLKKADKSISFIIKRLQLDDSAKYFCGLQERTVLEKRSAMDSDEGGDHVGRGIKCDTSATRAHVVCQVLPTCAASKSPETRTFSEDRSGVAQKVVQDEPTTVQQKGFQVTLKCRYEVPWSWSTYYLYWYKQLPDGKMTNVIRQYSSDNNAVKGRFSVKLQKADYTFPLTIKSLQLEDSAMYFCALSDTLCLK
ncbi:PREDICTED: uncharacterized protein LOC101625896 [Condylura cristata]|uniref:uncharacterized protein LOC101625896 n=1 Tax=Condylura cristata TaxID=143302 RepID=UPI0006433B69|nr:PREDICTED: uncharacterized protein LOC101625896 [Condylura cristata]